MMNLVSKNVYSFRGIKGGIESIFGKFIIFLKIISRSLFLKTKGLDKIAKSFFPKTKISNVISQFLLSNNNVLRIKFEYFHTKINHSLTIFRYNYFNIRKLRMENMMNLVAKNVHNLREIKQGIQNIFTKCNVFLKIISRSLFSKIKDLDIISQFFLPKIKLSNVMSQSFFSKSKILKVISKVLCSKNKILSINFEYFQTKINHSLTIFRYNCFNIRKLCMKNMMNLVAKNVHNFCEIKKGIQNIFKNFNDFGVMRGRLFIAEN